MSFNLFVLDSELPSFTGRESPQEQIRKMFNYLVQLKQSLQYSLRNLTADNFNTSALQTLTEGANVEVARKLNLMQSAITQVSNKADIISGRQSDADDRIAALEESDELLAGEIATLQEAFSALADTLSGENGILARLERAERLCSILSIGEDGTITLGTEEIPLHLVGQLYINGTAYGGDAT